jgi:hypothetical protein
MTDVIDLRRWREGAHTPETKTSSEADYSSRYVALRDGAADVNRLAEELGSPDEWLATAIDHLKVRSSGVTEGSVSVSVAALYLVLGHVEELEGRLGLIPMPPCAA